MIVFSSFVKQRPRLRAALFDFDGTLSTLRNGWEKVMEPLMLEMIYGGTTEDENLVREVKTYIDQSTGIQTIFQMKWLVEAIRKYERNTEASDDPWWYKNEYDKRLMKQVEKRKQSILAGEKSPNDYLIKGSIFLLDALIKNNIDIYVASGTDHPDVIKEAEVLGLRKYFIEISGAPVGREDCSKEAVLRRLVSKNGLSGPEVVVIGDGRVEIVLGNEVGALTLGVASNEEALYGINKIKFDRLVKAGANAITGDFEKIDEILEWLNL